MKTFTAFLLISFFFSVGQISAQDSPLKILWQRSLGSFDRDLAASIVNTIDGGFAVVGTVGSAGGDVATCQIRDIWVVKLNKAGTIEWEKSLGGNGEEEGYDIKVAPDGGYIVTGWTN